MTYRLYWLYCLHRLYWLTDCNYCTDWLTLLSIPTDCTTDWLTVVTILADWLTDFTDCTVFTDRLTTDWTSWLADCSDCTDCTDCTSWLADLLTIPTDYTDWLTDYTDWLYWLINAATFSWSVLNPTNCQSAINNTLSLMCLLHVSTSTSHHPGRIYKGTKAQNILPMMCVCVCMCVCVQSQYSTVN